MDTLLPTFPVTFYFFFPLRRLNTTKDKRKRVTITEYEKKKISLPSLMNLLWIDDIAANKGSRQGHALNEKEDS